MKHVTPPDVDDVTLALRNARRNVAIAKLSQFETECMDLGSIAALHPHRRREVVDCLYDIATANSLLSTHGGALIEDLIACGLEAR